MFSVPEYFHGFLFTLQELDREHSRLMHDFNNKTEEIKNNQVQQLR